jgi:hypothetical protein
MLEAEPGLRPVTLLEEMQRRHPDRKRCGGDIWRQLAVS